VRRRRSDRGAALIWAIVVLLAVMAAVALVSAGLARQSRTARLLHAGEAAADLFQAARVWGEHRLAADPGWTGPEELRLAGGTARVRLAGDGNRPHLDLEVLVRGWGEPLRRRVEPGGR